MDSNELERSLLLRQYELVRDEVTKSIFIQYDVIKMGTAFLSALLIAVPTAYGLFGSERLFLLGSTLIALAFVSMSFVFIMGAGEIRIMRAAAFSNRTFSALAGQRLVSAQKPLIWDKFVAEWNEALYGAGNEWKYQERVYLAMPFLVIAMISDFGAAIAGAAWIATTTPEIVDQVVTGIGFVACIGIQAWLYGWPARISRELNRAFRVCAKGDVGLAYREDKAPEPGMAAGGPA